MIGRSRHVDRFGAWLRELGASPRRKKTRRSLAMAALVVASLWIFGGSQGLVSLGSSMWEIWSLKREIIRLEKDHRELEARQAILARDRAYYEKFAREKLNLKVPGEIVFRFDRNK